MLKWSWKNSEWLMVAIALILGFGVFFLPSNEDKLDELARVAQERRDKWAAYDAAMEKRIAEHKAMSEQQAEELGIIYIPTPAQPVSPPASPPQR